MRNSYSPMHIALLALCSLGMSNVLAVGVEKAIITLNKPQVPFATHAALKTAPSNMQLDEIPKNLQGSSINFYSAGKNNECVDNQGKLLGTLLGTFKVGKDFNDPQTTQELLLNLKNIPEDGDGFKRICPVIKLNNGATIVADNPSTLLRVYRPKGSFSDVYNQFYLTFIDKKGPIFEAKNTTLTVDGDQCAWATPNKGTPKANQTPETCLWFSGPRWNQLWLCKHFGCQ